MSSISHLLGCTFLCVTVYLHIQVIEALCIPVGMTSEEGLEAQHKVLRRVREHHTRKSSRAKSNTDLVHWLLQASSPTVAQYRQRKRNRKRRPLLPEAKDLLIQCDSSLEIDPHENEASGHVGEENGSDDASGPDEESGSDGEAIGSEGDDSESAVEEYASVEDEDIDNE